MSATLRSSGGSLFKFGVALVSLPFLGSFAAKSASGISRTNEKNRKAHTYATVAAILSWVVFVLIIIGIFLLFFTGGAAVVGKSGFLISLLDLLCIAVIAVNAVLMMLVAIDLDNKAKGETNYKSWQYATGVSAGLFSLLGAYIIIKLVVWYRKRQREKKIRQEKFNRDVSRAYQQIKLVQSRIGPEVDKQLATAVESGRLHTELGAEIEASYQQHPENPLYSYIRTLYLQNKIKTRKDVDAIVTAVKSTVPPPDVPIKVSKDDISIASNTESINNETLNIPVENTNIAAMYPTVPS